ncbi:MAG: endolytic transglycosylase MltG [Spirochaetaceae bacterium]|nr:MAG: endolytic transglycosylase MltG [Spirochaetaceae bacterium]
MLLQNTLLPEMLVGVTAGCCAPRWLPRRGRRFYNRAHMKRSLVLTAGVALVVLLVLVLGAAGAYMVIQNQLYRPLEGTGEIGEAPESPDDAPPEMILEILPGQGLRTVSRSMVAAGLARNARLVEWYGRYRGFQTRLQAGRYQVSSRQSPAEILARIVAGDALFEEITVTIPEGWSLDDIASHLQYIGLFEAEQFREAVVMQESYRDFDFLGPLEDDTILDGYLFPETYRLFPESTPESLIRRMLVTFGRRVSPELRSEIDRQGRTLHEVLTLASIVQKESAGAPEMPDVAGVFWHRLRIGMRLESDATVNYVLGTNRRQPTFADTAVEHPYNTYRNAGLPPGPIGNPGMDAIMAAIYPSDTEYLFFLHKHDYEIVLSRTFAEHLAAKARYLD